MRTALQTGATQVNGFTASPGRLNPRPLYAPSSRSLSMARTPPELAQFRHAVFQQTHGTFHRLCGALWVDGLPGLH
jgi:hypothetical protein